MDEFERATGLAGAEALEKLLLSCDDPFAAVRQFQTENSLKVGDCENRVHWSTFVSNFRLKCKIQVPGAMTTTLV